jgi:DNA-binding transcriptional LysR family regulator
MPRPLPPLNALRAFEVAARHNSFTGAAAELNVSHAAISRHVRALEARLGVTLFRKASRGVELTPDGARYLQAISTAFDTIAEATGALASPAPARVRVSVHPAFAARWLIQRLGRFREAHPDCAVVLDATPRVVALEREEADIAIRNGDGSRPGLTRDLLARSRLYPVGARSLLGARVAARRGRLAPEDLTQLVLLHDEDDGGLWRRWFATAGIVDADVSRGLHILESGLAIDAAIAGQGIALADEFLIADDLAQGRLMKMCDVALSADDCDYYVVSLATAHRQRPVAVFREWLLRESESMRPAG